MSAPIILVVEDDAIIARHLQFVLRKLGYAVNCIVSSGPDAIQKASELLPDLILMDIHLEGEMDGVEAAEEIVKQNKIPIIYLTAYASDDLLKRARVTAPSGYILKPFEERHLHATIEMALQKHSLEIQLQEKNDQFMAVMAQLSDGFLMIDPLTHQIIEVNPAFTRMVGRSAEEILGKRIERILGLNTHQFWNTVKTSSPDHQKWHREYRYTRRDGSYLDLDVNLNKVEIRNQDFLCAVVRDITDHRAVEESLQKMQANLEELVRQRTGELEVANRRLEQLVEGRTLELEQTNVRLTDENRERRLAEEKFRNIVENAAVGIFQATLEGTFLSANPALAQFFGYNDPQDLIASVTDIAQQLYLHPDKRSDNLQKALQSSGFVELETEYRCKDGQEKLGLLHYRVVRDNNGNSSYIEGFVYDISQRKASENILRLSEERFRNIYNQTPVMLHSIDHQNRLIIVSDFWLETLGYYREEVLGRLFTDFLTYDSRRYALEVVEPAFTRSGFCKEIPYQFVKKNGEVIDTLFSAVSERDHSGKILSSMAVMVEITRLKRTEEQLQRQLQRLASLRALQMSITANMDLPSTLQTLLEQVTAQLSVDAAAILLLDQSTQELRYGAARGFRTPDLKSACLKRGEGYAGLVVQERKLISSTNLTNTEERQQYLPLLHNENFVTFHGVPLMVKGTVIGVLEVLHRSVLVPPADWIEYLNAFAAQAAIAIENITLFEEQQSSNRKLIEAYDATILGWSRTLEMRDQETEGHAQRVAQLTLDLARVLGVTDIDSLYRGALLHDIGKVGIPDSILLKPSHLTIDEWEIMRRHPFYAYELLSPVEFLRPALDIPYCHHERWDGSGYPRGLKGEQIPLPARIFAVMDVWDSLTQNRPYRPAWNVEKVRAYLLENAGILFDPHVVEAFLHLEV